MKLDKILKFLNKNDFLYKINKKSSSINYTPASLKHIVANGIYYCVSDISKFNIKDSVIFTSTQNVFSKNDSNIYIEVSNPQLTHYKLCELFVNKNVTATIHKTAIIDKNAIIGNNVSIGPYCIIGNCIIEKEVVLNSHVVVYDNVTIKEGAFVDSNSCIGAAGLAWIWDDKGERVIQPQLGGVIIEKKCYLGTDITIVRGSLSENTIVGENTVMSHGSKVGHGAQIGANVHFANNVSLAGNAVIGDRSFLGSASVVSSNIIVPKNTIIGAGAVVNKNFDEEYCTLVGVPAKLLKKNNDKSKPKGVPKPFKPN